MKSISSFVRGIHSCKEGLMLKTWGFHSVYGGKIDIKELHHEVFQESNSRNCHQTEWNKNNDSKIKWKYY